jgi:hypothetical protein
MLPTFLIGVWQAPAGDFAKWQSRGCNCAVCIPDNNDPAAWIAAANAANLSQIRLPVGDLATDARNATLLAWMHADEPDANHIPAATLAQNYQAYKAAAPNMPVMVTLSGGYVLGMQKGLSQSDYVPYLAAADWVAGDFYPVTGWNRPDLLGNVGLLVDRLASWSGGKPQIAFIECSNQGLPWIPGDRGPTAAEVRAEVWDAIIHGANGICYFPESYPAGGGAFAYDGTPADVAAEMTSINSAIRSLAFLTAAWPSMPLALPAPFQGRQWQQGSDHYAIALNLSPSAATLSGISAGGPVVAFDAYECGLWHNGQFAGMLGTATTTSGAAPATAPATNAATVTPPAPEPSVPATNAATMTTTPPSPATNGTAVATPPGTNGMAVTTPPPAAPSPLPATNAATATPSPAVPSPISSPIAPVSRNPPPAKAPAPSAPAVPVAPKVPPARPPTPAPPPPAPRHVDPLQGATLKLSTGQFYKLIAIP